MSIVLSTFNSFLIDVYNLKSQSHHLRLIVKKTSTSDTLHLHLGINGRLQYADWVASTLKTGAKSQGRIQYFINFINQTERNLGTKSTSGLFPAARDLLASRVSFCLTGGNRGYLRTKGKEASPCQGTMLRVAAHFSPQVPEHEEVSQPSVFVLKCSLSCPLNYLFLCSKDTDSFHDPLFAD